MALTIIRICIYHWGYQHHTRVLTMYVCVCKAVTDRQISQELAHGARNLRDLQTRLGVGTQCGKCCSCARRMVLEHICEQDVPAALDIPLTDSPLPA